MNKLRVPEVDIMWQWELFTGQLLSVCACLCGCLWPLLGLSLRTKDGLLLTHGISLYFLSINVNAQGEGKWIAMRDMLSIFMHYPPCKLCLTRQILDLQLFAFVFSYRLNEWEMGWCHTGVHYLFEAESHMKRKFVVCTGFLCFIWNSGCICGIITVHMCHVPGP